MSALHSAARPVGAPTGASRLRGHGADYAAHLDQFGGLPDFGRARRGGLTPLVAAIEQAGLRGRGGGWFPTATKMRAVADSAAKRRKTPVVIANGMEGEPASGKDAALLTTSPHLVIDGLVLAARAIGANEAYLALHRDSPVISIVSAALAQRAQAAASGPIPQLVVLPHRYVASEESALARGVSGQLAIPVFGQRPFQAGVGGRPTLVQNVETLADIGLIARFGERWFRGSGTPVAPGTALVTVAGAVAQPGIIEVAVGTPVTALLDGCGGSTGPVQAFLTGGYGGAWVGPELADVGWSPETVAAVGGVVGAGILTALPAYACGIRESARVLRWLAGESAGQCGPCRFGLSAVADDFERLAAGRASGADYARLTQRLGMVEGRGACRHPDGAVRFARSALTVFNDELSLHLRGGCNAPHANRVLPVPVPAPTPAPLPGEEWK